MQLTEKQQTIYDMYFTKKIKQKDIAFRLQISQQAVSKIVRKIRKKLSKKDVAAAIHTTPETLSRLLLRLKKQNRLTWEKKTIRIKEGLTK